MCVRNRPRTNRIINYLRNKENRREVSCAKYWENSDKEKAASQASNTDHTLYRASQQTTVKEVNYQTPSLSCRMGCGYVRVLPGLVIGRALIRKGQLPRLGIGRTLSPKGHHPGRPPIPITGRTLRKEGQLPVCPPIIGGTLIRRGQQFT